MRARLDRITEDLSRLVAAASVTGDEDRIQALAAEAMESIGLAVQQLFPDPASFTADPAYPGTEMPRTSLPLVVGRLAGGRPGRRLLLLGHVDVVPPGDPASWTSPAFEPRIADGRLYGRGACDMKGGVAAMLEAARLVAARREELAGELLLVTVPSEEDGGLGTLATIRSGIRADMAIIPEPTGLDIVVAHAGAITFELSVPGRAAHASTRREGVSALDKLAYLVGALHADEARRNDSETDEIMRALGLPYPTIVGTVRGGEWPSTVMDRVVADGRYGVRLGQTPKQAGAELEAAVREAWERDEFLARHPVGVRVWGGAFGSARVAPDHPLPAGLARAAQQVTGRTPNLVGAPYGADMHLLVNEAGVPTVMYGPGSVLNAHSADEYVLLEDVATCAEVLAGWILSELTPK